jgi:hypothetical protein
MKSQLITEVEAFNIMRKAAENSHGTLAYHQNLQSAIEVIAQMVIAQMVIKESGKEEKKTED